ncbi:NDR1/HIN1-like protein 13 [Amaranthus tricolor]|uniref:NDR1/HIN1-like protein 13 n=1 Tax=Amaranthus tricolor TaxID=29722 RepID=UPI00258379D9|nr:NDR1/HIN1-like protein 13 [Amaranthus tricolor]
MTSTTMAENRRSTPSSHQFYYSNTPSYFSTSSSSPSLIKGCCCCLFLLFSLLALLTLAVILVIVLAVKPKKPTYDLQQVAVQYVGISPTPTASPAGVSLSLSVRLLFTAVNPNKVGLKYGESRFTVMYKGIPLGRGVVPGFYQPAHSVKNVETVVTVDRVNLMQADASDLVKDASMYDKVELTVMGDVSAKIRIISFDSPGVQVSVNCEIVLSPKKQSLTYKQCGFDGLHI